MKNESIARENRTCAVLAGIFLLLYAVPLLLFSVPGEISEGNWSFLLDPPLMVFLAAIFLLLRKPKIAAVLITVTVLAGFSATLSQISQFLEPSGYLATYDAERGYAEYIPSRYVSLPILDFLAFALLAAALYFRGGFALVLSLFAAAAEVLYMFEQLNAMSYVTGHPTPLNVFFPFNYAMGAVFAGFFLLQRRKHRTRGQAEPAVEGNESSAGIPN